MGEEICKILIVEDDKSDVALYKSFLQSHANNVQYDFYDATTSAQALALYKDCKPDCVLLDYMLPDGTGIDLLKQLSYLDKILPVVMITGQSDEQIAAETIKCGAQNYVSKKIITSESLYRAVTNTIDRTRLLQQVANQNEQLKIEKDRAEKADRAKSDFLATMSHEIRTPLNGIIGMAELMAYTQLNKKQRQYVHSIHSSGALLLAIINDILDFSKIDAGEMELEHEEVDLKSLLRDVVHLMDGRASENNVDMNIIWPVGENPIPKFKGDPVRLRQVILNLLGNAIKFTKNGTVYIHASVTAPEGDHQRYMLRMEVEDTGIGIPEDKIDSIFARFSQVDSSTTREFGGSGLGLAISRKIIELMGGRIGVKSECGVGSTFWFDIPVDFTVDPKLDLPMTDEILAASRILLVNEKEITSAAYLSYLDALKCHVTQSDSLNDSLDILRDSEQKKNPYDFVIVDYSVHKGERDEFLEVLKNTPQTYGSPQTMLIFGLGEKSRSRDVMKDKVVLFKPVFPEELIDGVMNFSGKAYNVSENTTGYVEEIEQEDMSSKLPKVNAKILIVDDDRISLRMSKSILSELSCDFDTARNGQEAVDILEARYQDYDFVFMDWQMPVMDGHEAIKYIRSQKWGEGIRILALTANAIQGDREKCLKAGADDYLSKPLSIFDVAKLFQQYGYLEDDVMPSSMLSEMDS